MSIHQNEEGHRLPAEEATVCTGAGALAFLGQEMEFWWGRLSADVFLVVSRLNNIADVLFTMLAFLVGQVC